MEKTTVCFKKLRPEAAVPTYGSEGSAGADLSACLTEAECVNPGETRLIPTGIAVQLPPGHAGFVYARSGLAAKRGLAPANKVGVIDSDYRGEILVAVHNHSNKPSRIQPGERIAQLVVAPVARAEFVEADALSETARGAGGFGSTGEQ